MPAVGKLITEWSKHDIYEDQIRYWMDERGVGRAAAIDFIDTLDDDWINSAYDAICHDITLAMERNKHHGWHARVENFGWRRTSGSITFVAVGGKALLLKILPRTECTFKVFRYGRGIAIQNWHHDNSSGDEWYYIVPRKVR